MGGVQAEGGRGEKVRRQMENMHLCVSEVAGMTRALIGIKGRAFKGIRLKCEENFPFKVTPST